MGDISNKTLAILVVIAIIVSLVSLFIGRGVVTVGKGPSVAEQDIGLVQATVTADVQIWAQGDINFGNQQPGGAAVNSETEEYILVASTGGTPADIDYWTDDTTGNSGVLFDNLLATGLPNSVPVADGSFQFHLVTPVGQSITVGPNTGAMAVCGGTYTPVLGGGYGNIAALGSGSPALLVTDCNGANRQGFRFGVQIQVPNNEPTTAKSVTVWASPWGA